MSQVRINKYIASTGTLSRRKADELILSGRVAVNGEKASPGNTIDPDKDEVTIDGKAVHPLKPVYLAMYKPRNVVTTMHDPQGRDCIRDLIPKKYSGVFPVGRLDFDAEGLLLLTNDGRLAQTLHHPSHDVPKTYIVKLIPRAEPDQLKKMEEGIELDGIKTRRAEIEVLRSHARGTTMKITLRQGLKNQIKRMASAVGLKVTSIKRTSVGPVSLEGLFPGQIRELNSSEIGKLRKTLK
jgi:23S rRNA pseudouridine2605 synthase